jgi:hypothetical protein
MWKHRALQPGIKGFSPLNAWRMRAFFRAHRDTPQSASPAAKPILSQAATEITSGNLPQAVTDFTAVPEPFASNPWGHNQVLLFKLKDPVERIWYAAKTVHHGWSRAVLTAQIESDLFGRQGKAVSNFAATIPSD